MLSCGGKFDTVLGRVKNCDLVEHFCVKGSILANIYTGVIILITSL